MIPCVNCAHIRICKYASYVKEMDLIDKCEKENGIDFAMFFQGSTVKYSNHEFSCLQQQPIEDL